MEYNELEYGKQHINCRQYMKAVANLSINLLIWPNIVFQRHWMETHFDVENCIEPCRVCPGNFLIGTGKSRVSEGGAPDQSIRLFEAFNINA